MNNKTQLSLFISATILAAGTMQQASAQNSLLETIVVTTDRQERVIQDIPTSIHAVSTEMLDTFKHVHVGEILNTVPGIVFNRGNGQESLLGIRSPVLTGAGSCGSYQVAEDGIPVRGAGFCNVNQLFDANTEQAGSIEVLRGPGSVLFGVNALHGAINVISPSLAGDTGGVVSLDAGPHEYRRVNLGYRLSDDSNGFGIFWNGATDGGYKDDSGFDQNKINIGHRFDNGNVRISTVFSGAFLDQETAGYISGFEAYKDDSLKKVNGDPLAYRDSKGIHFHSRIEGDTDNGTWMLTPYFRDLEMDFLMHFLPGTPVEENGHESVGLQSMYSLDASDTTNWTFGLDVEATDGYLKQTQAGGFGAFPAGKQYDFTVDARMWSPYVLATFQTSDSNQLSFGLRYEALDYDYDNLMIDGNTAEDGTPCPGAGCRYSRPSDRSDSFDNYTAQVGWVHDYDSSSQLFANLSFAFRAPQATELYRLQANQTVADLDSERVKSIEAGYRASHERLSYSVAAYFMKKDDVIFQDSNRNNISGGKTEHKGVEFNGIWSLADSLSLNIVTSYARHTYEANIAPLGVTILLDGKDMDTAPKLTGNIQLNWQLDMKNSLNFEWMHMGPYYTDDENLHRYEGHELFNLRYRYAPSDDWFFAARVLNVFDTDYAERADYTGFGGDRYFVGEPASLYITVGRNLN